MTEPQPGPPEVSAADTEMREKILTALQSVQDPEIGFSVIDLELIREVIFGGGEAEVRMIFTTPFCPYGPMLVSQVQLVAEEASGMPIRVTVLPDKWEPPIWLR